MEVNYKQRGFNSAYPQEVIVWDESDKKIPEWIVNVCRVTGFDEENNPVIKTEPLKSGGKAYYSSAGSVLFSTTLENDVICKEKNSDKIIVFSNLKFNLLYKCGV